MVKVLGRALRCYLKSAFNGENSIENREIDRIYSGNQILLFSKVLVNY